jgi:hypothetical protein
MISLCSVWEGFYPRRAGKGKGSLLERSAGKPVAKPDSRVFSAEFTFTALEIGDSVPI